MNIILVSVTERTREIGILLAVDATERQVLLFAPSARIVLAAFVFSALVGVVFGYFPARRAARMDPIEALRHQ